MKHSVLAGIALLLPAAVAAQSLDDQVSVCTACHGEKGVPADASIPVIFGQKEGYLYLELRDYKRGDRKNEIMQQVAGTLEKSDMRALAAFFAAKPPPSLQQPGASDEVARRAQIMNGSAGCEGCHGQGYAGDSAIPRLAGQSEAYLHATMLAFKTGERGNNPWMSALLKTYSDEDIAAMAKYLAGL